jgi:hypothetical protein
MSRRPPLPLPLPTLLTVLQQASPEAGNQAHAELLQWLRDMEQHRHRDLLQTALLLVALILIVAWVSGR